MHNAAFSYAGLNWRYVPLPVRSEHLAPAIKGLGALGFRGVNVTVPHKVDVIPHMDTITESVRIVGAVNTIRVDRNTGHLEGMNTDMGGFLTDLAANRVSMGKTSRVLILGAGGACRAVGAALVRSGAHVIIANRTLERAQSVAAFLKSSWTENNVEVAPMDSLAEASRGVTLVVNTTSVGMWPEADATPWPAGVPFPAGATLYDTVYRPLKTRLMADAEAAGLRVMNGLGMLVYQGAAAYEVWTGRKAPTDVMRLFCMQALGEANPTP